MLSGTITTMIIESLIAIALLFLTHYLSNKTLKTFFKQHYQPLISLLTDLTIILFVRLSSTNNHYLLLLGLFSWAHFIIFSLISPLIKSTYYPSSNIEKKYSIIVFFLLFLFTRSFYQELMMQIIANGGLLL